MSQLVFGNTSQQIAFCENICQQITIAIRGIWADEETTAEQKVVAMKWINEFNHCTQNLIFSLRNTPANAEMEDLLADAKTYSSHDKIAEENLNWIIKNSFEKVKENNEIYDNYFFILSSLISGNKNDWERIASENEDFPQGCDQFTRRNWITNAIDCGSLASVKWILLKNINLRFVNNEGYSVLHSCLDRTLADKHEILQLLLDNGADVNIGTQLDKFGLNGWSPLHMAAARNDLDAIKILLKNGADTTLKTIIDNYCTAEEEAKRLGNLEAADLIKHSKSDFQKYKITTDKIDGSSAMSKFDAELPTTEEILFTFETDSYNKAAAINNQFLGFGQYIPMPENIVCERDLEISKKGVKISDVKIVIWQAQKMLAGEWKCNYQIRGINENRTFGICGIDSFQAVQEAYKMVENHLENFRKNNPELSF